MPFDEALGTYAVRPNCMLVLVHFSTRLCRFHMRPEWAFGDVSAGSDHGSFAGFYELGRNVRKGDMQAKHLRSAREIFERLGASYYAQHAERLELIQEAHRAGSKDSIKSIVQPAGTGRLGAFPTGLLSPSSPKFAEPGFQSVIPGVSAESPSRSPRSPLGR
jgi:hypothetical protein